MIRKSIQTLVEMPDRMLLMAGVTIADIQQRVRKGERRARLLAEMASLSKRMINEGVAFEDLLSTPGIINVSAALYSLEWAELYYQAQDEQRRRRERGYWRCLWDALQGK